MTFCRGVVELLRIVITRSSEYGVLNDLTEEVLTSIVAGKP